MPLGAFRLNTLAKLQGASVPAPTGDAFNTYTRFGDETTDTWSGWVDHTGSGSTFFGGLSLSADVTFSCWFNATMLSGASQPESFGDGWSIIDLTDVGNRPIFALRVKDDGGLIAFFGKSNANENYTSWLSSSTFTADTWHHIYFSHDGSASTYILNIDGVSVTPNNTPNSGGSYNFNTVSNIAIASNFKGQGGGLKDKIKQLYFNDSYDSNTTRFYNSGYVYMGPHGVASGAERPLIYVEGDTGQQAVNGGDLTLYVVNGENTDPDFETSGPPWTIDSTTVNWDSTPDSVTSRTRKSITVTNVTANNTGEKFGYSCMDHVGSTIADSWLEVSASSDFNWGTGDYTIEAWYNADNQSRTRYLWDTRNASTNGSYLYIDSSNNLNLVTGATTTTGTASISTGTFYHIATVRNSGTTKVYVNGVEDISVSDSTNHTNSSGAVYIGSDYLETTQQTFGGLVDEVRISDNARYTTGFTVATARHSNDSATLFLLHGDVENGTTVFWDDNNTG